MEDMASFQVLSQHPDRRKYVWMISEHVLLNSTLSVPSPDAAYPSTHMATLALHSATSRAARSARDRSEAGVLQWANDDRRTDDHGGSQQVHDYEWISGERHGLTSAYFGIVSLSIYRWWRVKCPHAPSLQCVIALHARHWFHSDNECPFRRSVGRRTTMATSSGAMTSARSTCTRYDVLASPWSKNDIVSPLLTLSRNTDWWNSKRNE